MGKYFLYLTTSTGRHFSLLVTRSVTLPTLRAISLLEPSLILIMGLIVGFIVVAVLLPIFELNQIMQ